jgi:MFS family permease
VSRGAGVAPPDGRIDARLLGIAFILVLGTFMATVDATIVSVGITTLADEFGASVTEIQWVTTAYLLAVVAAVPAAGWLADRFGARRVWLLAVGVFLVGSALCALAWSAPSLIAFRVVQGLGGGLLPPLGQALVARAAGPGRTGRVISIVAVVPLLSPVLGPLLGGAVLGVASWPWLFAVNLPVGAVAILLARRFVPVLAASRGWKVGEIVVHHRARQFGRSKYGVTRIVKGFLDLLARMKDLSGNLIRIGLVFK